jgi:hypothetical protein
MKIEIIDGIRYAVNKDGDGWEYDCESCEHWDDCFPYGKAGEPCERWHPENWESPIGDVVTLCEPQLGTTKAIELKGECFWYNGTCEDCGCTIDIDFFIEYNSEGNLTSDPPDYISEPCENCGEFATSWLQDEV